MQQRPKTIRLIRLAMAAAVLLPCALFAFGSWTTYRNLHILADERLLRSLDVQQEEATKTFELINLTMGNASDLVVNMSGDDIHQACGQAGRLEAGRGEGRPRRREAR